MPRAERIGLVFEQQMHVLIAQVEPEDHKIKRSRFIDFLQAEHIPIEAPAALHVGDNDGAMVQLGNLECWRHNQSRANAQIAQRKDPHSLLVISRLALSKLLSWRSLRLGVRFLQLAGTSTFGCCPERLT